MGKIHNASETTLIIQQETETWFINRKEESIEMRCEFMTTDGYEEGITMSLDTEEAKSLFQFLKDNQF